MREATIFRQVIRGHGLSSAMNEGNFSLARSETPRRLSGSYSEAGRNKELKNVLVVEDNELDSSQMAKMLQRDNISVTIASTVQEAIAEAN